MLVLCIKELFTEKFIYWIKDGRFRTESDRTSNIVFSLDLQVGALSLSNWLHKCLRYGLLIAKERVQFL